MIHHEQLEGPSPDEDETLEVSTGGAAVMVSTARDRDAVRFAEARERMHAKYARAFARLAK